MIRSVSAGGAAASPGGGGQAGSGTALFIGRPALGGGGGLIQVAYNQLEPEPFAPPTGSGHGPRDVGVDAFGRLDELIDSYVANYLATLGDRDTSGGTSVSITGSDLVGTYAFEATVSYNYAETGTTLGAYAVNDTDGYSYSFSESGVAVDGTTFTLNEFGSGNSTVSNGGSSGDGGSGSDGGGGGSTDTTTLSELFGGVETYTLQESTNDTGAVGAASATTVVATQHSGSDSFTLGGQQPISRSANTYTWSEVGDDYSTAGESDVSATSDSPSGGSETLASTVSTTDVGSLHHALESTVTDALGSGGVITGGGRSLTYDQYGTDTYTSAEWDSDQAGLGSGSSTATDSSTLVGNDTQSEHQTGTESYAAYSGYSWYETGSDSLSLSDVALSTLTGTSTSTDLASGISQVSTIHSNSTATTTDTESGTATLTLQLSGTETATSATVSSGSDGETWDESDSLTDATTATLGGSSTEVDTSSSTRGAVTASDTLTTTASSTSTPTDSETDLPSLHETGSETISGGLVASGYNSQNVSDTITGSSTDFPSDGETTTGSGTSTATLGDVTSTEVYSSQGGSNSSETDTEQSTSTLTPSNSTTLGAGGVAASGTGASTLHTTATDTLSNQASTSTETDTTTDTSSSTLGGAADASTLSDTHTTTEVDTGSGTQTTTESDTSSEAFSAGIVTGGGDNDSSTMTGTGTTGVTGTETDHSSGTETTTGTLGGLATTSTLTPSGSTTTTTQDNATSTSNETSSDVQSAGANGVVASATETDSFSGSGTDSSTLYEIDQTTQGLTSAWSSTAGGVTDSGGSGSTDTDTQTYTTSETSAPSQASSVTTTLGAGGFDLGGTEGGWSSSGLIVGSHSLYDTASGTESDSDLATSTLGDVTLTSGSSPTSTYSSTDRAWGQDTGTDSASESGSTGIGGLDAGGSGGEDTTSTDTTTESDSQASTSTDHPSQHSSSTLGGVTSSETETGLAVSTDSSTAAGTMTETDTENSTDTSGSGGAYVSGLETDISTSTGTESDGSTDTTTDTTTLTGGDTISTTDSVVSDGLNDTTTETSTVTGSDSSSPAGTDWSTVTYGVNAVVSGAISSDTLYGIGFGSQSATETIVDVSAPTQSTTSVENDDVATDAMHGNATDTSHASDSMTATTTEDDSGTVSYGSSDVVISGHSASTLTTNAGSDGYSLSETDSSTAYLSGNEANTLGLQSGASSYSDTVTDGVTTTDQETEYTSGVTTQATSLGPDSTVTFGTVSDGESTSGSSSTTVTDHATTLVSESEDQGFSSSSASSSQPTTITGTQAAATTVVSTDNSTGSDGDLTTVGTDGLVSSSTSSSTLYHYGDDSTTVTGLATLTTTTTAADTESNDAQGTTLGLNTTTTVTDATSESPYDSFTATQSDGETLGLDATISGGSGSSTDWGGSTDSYSLYETGAETQDNSSNSNLAGGSGLATSNTITGTVLTSQTATSTDSESSTDSGTYILGSGGVMSSSGSTHSIYETSGGGTTAGSSGSDTTTMAVSGNASSNTTFGLGVSTTMTGASSATETLVSTESDGLDGRITWGLVNTTLTSGSTVSDTNSESGDQSLNLGSGSGSLIGPYSQTMTDSTTDSQSSTSARTLGLDGTIASGTDNSTLSTTTTTSDSTSEGGSQVQDDPAGGPAFSAPFSSSEVVTGYNSGVENDNDTVTTGGTITEGTDVSATVARNTDDRTLALSEATDSFTEVDHGSFSETMTGTETMTTGGTISGGSDSYTWDQTVNNQFTLAQQAGGGDAGTTVAGSSRLYYISDTDALTQSLHDVGDDILGAKDTIVDGSDSYTWLKQRDEYNTVVDYGTSASAYNIVVANFDFMNSTDVGGSSLSVGGHTLASDCYTYSELSGDVDNFNQTDVEVPFAHAAYGSAGAVGGAHDYYSDLDIGTISSSDATTYAEDSFYLDNSDYVSSNESGTYNDGTETDGYDDVAIVDSYLQAHGTKGSDGQDYNFTQGEFTTDDYVASQTYNGGTVHYTVANFEHQTDTDASTGLVQGTSGQTYSFSETENEYSSLGYAGAYLPGGAFGVDTWSTETMYEVETSPPLSVDGPHDFSDGGIVYSPASGPGGYGGGYGASRHDPSRAANLLGNYRGQGQGGAVHEGTATGPLDDSNGLLSALGGEDAHAMETTLPEMEVDQEGTGMVLDDGSSPWSSRPQMGYRRSAGGGGGSGSMSEAESPQDGSMPSGTANGTAANVQGGLNNGLNSDQQKQGATQARPQTQAQATSIADGGTSPATPMMQNQSPSSPPQTKPVKRGEGVAMGKNKGGALNPYNVTNKEGRIPKVTKDPTGRALQFAGGLIMTVSGIYGGIVTAPTIAGAIAGFAVAAKGIDNMQAAIRGTDTLTAQAAKSVVRSVSGNEKQAAAAGFVADVATDVGPGGLAALGRAVVGGGKALFNTARAAANPKSAILFSTGGMADDAAKAVGKELSAASSEAKAGAATSAAKTQLIAPRAVPQGLTEAQFNEAASAIRAKTAHIEGELVVQGSRASGTAGATSDIDFAVRVSQEQFDALIKARFGTPNPGSAKLKTMQHAIKTGKIQAGEAGLRPLRVDLEGKLNMEVDISVILKGGEFDNPPFIPLPE